MIPELLVTAGTPRRTDPGHFDPTMILLRRSYRFLLLLCHLGAGCGVAAWLKVASPFRSTLPGAAASPQWWFARLCRILRLTVTVRGEASRDASFVVANHISWMDIVALGAVAPTNFVSKAEIRSWPVFGWMANAGGTVFIPRGANQARAVVEQVSERLDGGCSVVVFAEATTSDGKQVRRFYPRLFAAPVESGCPVQPVAIRYPHPSGVHPAAPFIDDEVLIDNLMGVLAQPSMEVELTFLPEVSAEGRDRKGLAAEAHAAIAAIVEGEPA